MKIYSTEQQENFLYDMKKLIDSIRSARVETGEEHKNHTEILQKIDILYNKLDYKYQEQFNDYVN
jgi:hypothetical protein